VSSGFEAGMSGSGFGSAEDELLLELLLLEELLELLEELELLLPGLSGGVDSPG
jgi:hypothetical protein